jgi:hypothetical protein
MLDRALCNDLRHCFGGLPSLPQLFLSASHRAHSARDTLLRVVFACSSTGWPVHEDLPGRAPANSTVVTTAACLAMTVSSSIACTSASGSAQQSRTTTNR